MKFLKNGIIFLTLFGVFFAILNVSVKKRIQLKLCAHYAVEKIEIKKGSELINLNINPQDNYWYVQSGELSDQAHDDGIRSITKFICYLPFVEDFSMEKQLTPEELAGYGFTADSRQITVTTRNNEKIVLKFGDNTPSGTEVYHINSKAPDHVYTISNTFSSLLDQSYMALIRRLPFFDLKSGQKIKIDYSGFTFDLEYQNGVWQEGSKKITEAETQTLINLLSSLRFQQFKGPLKGSDRDTYALDFPNIALEWEDSAGKKRDFKFISLTNGFFMSYILGQDEYLLILTGKEPAKLMGFLDSLLQKMM